MTYDQIAAELGVSKSSCSLWLRDVPVDGGPPPGCSPEAHERSALARQLRVEGHPLREIAARLGVSSKTAYYWTWDLPAPPRARPGGDDEHMAMMRRRYWDRVLAERAGERQAVVAAHAARIAQLSTREVEIAAVVAYWCEGTKSKPYARRERVTFVNSDPALILLFLTWLDQVAFPPEHRRYSLSIHASADVPSATAWWADVIGVDVERIGPPTLKRHNPRTVRKNVDEAYVGCLVVRLVQSRLLYQQIEGLWQGIMGALPVVQAVDLPGSSKGRTEIFGVSDGGSNPSPGAFGCWGGVTPGVVGRLAPAGISGAPAPEEPS